MQVHEFYRVNHSNLNKHTIRIVKSLVEARELSFTELKEYRVVDKTCQLIKAMLSNKQEWCLELLLDINHGLLTRFNEVVKTRESEISKLIDDIFANFDICV
jgi:mevalonate kinase